MPDSDDPLTLYATAFIEKDRRRFAEAYRFVFGRLCGWARRLTVSDAEAEDAVARTMEELHGMLCARGANWAYLYKRVRFRCFDRWKKLRREQALPPGSFPSVPDPDRRVVLMKLVEMAEVANAKASGDFDAWLLDTFDGRRRRILAEELGVSVGGLRQRVCRATRRLVNAVYALPSREREALLEALRRICETVVRTTQEDDDERE